MVTNSGVHRSPGLGDLLMTDHNATQPEVIARYLRSEYLDSGANGSLAATRRAAAMRTKPVLAIHSTKLGASREGMLPAPAGSRVDTWTGHGRSCISNHPIDSSKPLPLGADGSSRKRRRLRAQSGARARGW